MALNTRLAAASQNAAAEAIVTRANSGFLRIYDGTQRATPDTALGAQVLLAQLALSATAGGSGSAGVVTFNAITNDSAADATGTATWCAIVTSGGAAVFDGSVGTSAANLVLGTTSIVANAVVSVSSLTFTIPMQGA